MTEKQSNDFSEKSENVDRKQIFLHIRNNQLLV